MILTEEDKQIIKKYGHLFNNTGGNDIIELIERNDINYFSNPIVAELQGCCYSQLQLLKTLKLNNII
ncbi:MAG: hypothetical protein PHC28_13685 [Flavobacterium sp.]|uniref:hypothetical protein n=1 Tax=Flavobacterium sp. TaxID=239 RepID=UPI002607B887|nr:hypothetical protein [Flavobacterium sp.]MDD5151504.1 hypothetical protein [Flavobacterium sp.]